MRHDGVVHNRKSPPPINTNHPRLTPCPTLMGPGLEGPPTNRWLLVTMEPVLIGLMCAAFGGFFANQIDKLRKK